MECQSQHSEGQDLIDFSSDNELLEVKQDPNILLKRNKSAPMLKSTDHRRMNSDVVAIQRENGEVAFVAVGRIKSNNTDVKLKQERRKSYEIATNNEYQVQIVPKSTGGIDNLGYTTVARGETYIYDQTGENYYSTYPDRWSNLDLIHRNGKLGTSHSDHRNGEECNNGSEEAPLRHPNEEEDVPNTSEPQIPELDQDNVNVSTPVVESSEESSQEEEASQEPTDLNDENVMIQKSKETTPKLPPLCKCCGQRHGVTENHEYDYVEEVDEDLMCDICLQPLVDPYDTKCGHTFCCVCIKNYLRIKHMCPIDRQEMENASSDCWQSSLILRKLIDKLQVNCPNAKYCEVKMQRCDLKNHLKERCPGAMIRCPKSMYGCIHKAPRTVMEQHLENCEYRDFDDKLSDLHPYCEDLSVELFRPEGTAELGIMVVGGSDTPLHYVIIQDIVPDSLAAADGRLQAGDVLVEINGEPMYSVTHAEARAALTKPSNLMRFSLLREVAVKEEESHDPDSSKIKRSSSMKSSYSEETVSLIKPPLEQLGIRISSSETGVKGVYIIELIDGQVAQADGRLQMGDRIMAIGNTDLSESTPEQAARVIGNCNEEVKILVRHLVQKSSVFANEWAEDKTLHKKKESETASTSSTTTALSRSQSFPPPPKPVKSSHIKKIISVTKSPKENLGIIVSGGHTSPRGNLPIFVQDVLPMSVLGKDKRIKRGDLLLQINSSRLVGLTHTQAMNILRESAQQRDVNIVAYELDYEGMAEDAALWDELTSLHQHPSKWAPSWKMWLSVTPEFVVVREVTLRKSPSASYGIKITGGFTKENGASPIFITHVARKPGSSASKYLKSGDEIIAVNKRYVKGMPYINVLNLMKTMNSVMLRIVSWPGSLH